MIGECADCGRFAKLYWIPDPNPSGDAPTQPTLCADCKTRRD